MIRFFLLLVLTAMASDMIAQRQDNTWLLCYRYSFLTQSNNVKFDFGDSLEISSSYADRPMSFNSSSTFISDSSGNLLLYSNGCYVANADGSEVENSQGLNPGFLFENCEENDGYNFAQNMVLLPDPGNKNIFHLFHLPVQYNAPNSFFYPLMRSVVDRSLNNGESSMIIKNQPIVEDTIHYDGIHAVRHANGRDWWIVTAKKNSNKYYFVLLSPSGIKVQEQYIGVPTWNKSQGQIVFSPDGSKLARFNAKDDLRIFDFDRCTGLLSNPQHILMPGPGDNQLFSGCAWSADSRYLYAQENYLIYQFDTDAADVAASKTLAAQWDAAARCPFTVEFGFMELGPDGRIYCAPLNGQHCMHRMNHPERAGSDCDMQLSYYNFEYPYKNLPHFPNFRLGPVDGSACDSLGLDNHPLAGWRYDRSGGLGVDFTSVSWYEPTAWSWAFGDGSGGSTERNPAHTFPAAGPYEVCLTVSNAYGSDTKCKTVWVGTVAAGEPWAEAGKVVLYPNPTTGLLRWTGTEGQPLTIRVLDPLGRVQLEQTNEGGQIDLSRLPTGLYLVQLRTGDGALLTTQKVSLLKP